MLENVYAFAANLVTGCRCAAAAVLCSAAALLCSVVSVDRADVVARTRTQKTY